MHVHFLLLSPALLRGHVGWGWVGETDTPLRPDSLLQSHQDVTHSSLAPASLLMSQSTPVPTPKVSPGASAICSSWAC